MRGSSLAAFMLVCGLQTATGLAASHPNALTEQVVVDGVTAVLEVAPANDYPREGYYVTAVFHAPNDTPVQLFCLSVIQDFHYELRNSSGAVIPVDPRVFSESALAPGWSEPGPCATREHTGGRSTSLMPLAAFYPRVPPGAYTLQVTFAPRGLSQQVALRPITITVDKDHPL